MQVNWGRLQIEQSTWSAHARVERLARQQMKMRSPNPADIRLVRQ
jgi:cell division protein FtsL